MTQAIFEEANALLAQGQLGPALARYDALLAREPGQADVLANRGVALQMLGRLPEAVASYDAALSQRPGHPDALANRGFARLDLGQFAEALADFAEVNMLAPQHVAAQYGGGMAHQRLGQASVAIESYDRVLQLAPEHALAMANRGVALFSIGLMEEALAAFDAALARAPQDADAWSNRGNVLGVLGRAEEALVSCDRALALRPDFPEALFHRGNALLGLRRFGEAMATLDRAIALRPAMPEPWSSRGAALAGLGRGQEGLASHDRALLLRPGDAAFLQAKARTLEGLGRQAEALALTEQALQVRPADIPALHQKAIVLHAMRRDEEAIATLDRALAHYPDNADMLADRSAILHRLGRDEEGLAVAEASLRQRPDFFIAICNRGVALHALQRTEEAIVSLRQAAALAPAEPRIPVNLAYALLMDGQLEEGFAALEMRKQVAETRVPRQFEAPMWDGQRPVAGKTVFLHWEQGFGDTLQMARYAALFQAQGARVVLSVQDALLPLFRDWLPGVAVIGAAAPAPAFDEQVSLLSLPHVFRTRLDTIPPVVPFHADPARAAAWEARLGAPRGRRIGLVWAGAPQHRNNHNRSMPAAALAPLLTEPADWIAVQKEMTEEDRVVMGACRWFGPELTDFGETAALIAALDLVITVDTSVAHLAASMGKPVWLLLAFVLDWRWLRERTDTPWYPSMRLFRQPRAGDWAAVTEALRAGLRAGGTETESST
jgi:tetratricopeptide (TPR) repeat protein